MATKTAVTQKKEAAFRIPEKADVYELIEDTKEAFYPDPNVIGVGVGERRKGDATHQDEIALIVYVKTKIPESEVNKEYLIPQEFEGMATDVVAPFGRDASQEALGFAEGHQHSDDMSFIDWPRLHEQWLAEAGGEIAGHGKVQDFGDVCVIEDDGTLVKTINGQRVVDFVRAYKLFRTTHPDIYDFVTFFTDSAHGMPPQGGSSWYRFVHNDTQGIGLGSFNQRAEYGSAVLQGIKFLNEGHFPIWRYVMLQEQGHRWGSFARYRDSASGPNRNDHMLGGWGHWTRNLDDDLSPMDYDVFDWEATNGNFRRVAHSSKERTYCNLDLYLMGLLGQDEVGDFYLLENVARISGNEYSATKKRLTIQNIMWAEGPRSPSVATSQKLFKNGFVVLTGDMSKVHDYVDRVDFLRLRFEDDFYEATKNLGRVDTALGPLRVELTPSQVRQLTSQRHTALHRYGTGTQFTGIINPGQSQRWFTHSWPRAWHVGWLVVPTTIAGGGPKIRWDVQTERTTSGITYWITIRNVSSQRIAFEARYSITSVTEREEDSAMRITIDIDEAGNVATAIQQKETAVESVLPQAAGEAGTTIPPTAETPQGQSRDGGATVALQEGMEALEEPGSVEALDAGAPSQSPQPGAAEKATGVTPETEPSDLMDAGMPPEDLVRAVETATPDEVEPAGDETHAWAETDREAKKAEFESFRDTHGEKRRRKAGETPD